MAHGVGVCSKDVNGCSYRAIGAPVFAVKHVNRRCDAGSVGGPIRSIVRRRRAAAIARNKAGVSGSGDASGKRRQLTSRRRARVSAYSRAARIPRIGPAIGRVATPFSRRPMNIRASVFAAWCADWLCVVCWIAKRVIERGVVGCVGSG